jgi:hypothetical protein
MEENSIPHLIRTDPPMRAQCKALSEYVVLVATARIVFIRCGEDMDWMKESFSPPIIDLARRDVAQYIVDLVDLSGLHPPPPEACTMSSMSEMAALWERLAKTKALAARGATSGERDAARAAVERIRRRLEDYAEEGRPAPEPSPTLQEFRFMVRDPWGRQIFAALCLQEGLPPYRRKFLRRSTFLVGLPDIAAARRLMARYRAIEKHLRRDLQAVTERVIMERVRGKR